MLKAVRGLSALGGKQALCGLASAVAIGATGAGAAQAQEGASSVDVLVITAQRREESIQRVPISVQAFGAEALEQRQITETFDLQFAVPNFQANGGGLNGQRVAIRGIGANIVGAGADSAVATYRDGVYLARQYSAEAPFLDVDRIEVLRGPQGTLYGRNATGGAINAISKLPEFEFGLEGKVTFGEYSDRAAQATINVPLSETAAFRGTVATRYSESFMENRLQPEKNGENDYWQGKASLLIQPNEALSILVRGDFIDAKQLNFTPLKMVQLSPVSAYGLVDFDPFTAGVQPIPVPNILSDAFVYESDIVIDPYKQHEEYGLSLKVDYDFGGATLTSLTSYRDMETRFVFDQTGNNSTYGYAPGMQAAAQFSQDFQITSDGDGRLQWLAGLSYAHETPKSRLSGLDPTEYFRTDLYPLLGFTLVYRAGEIESDAAAFFVEGNYDLTEKLRVTAAGRYSWEQKSARLVRDVNGTLAAGIAEVALNPDEKSWTNFSPKVGVEYFPDSTAMLYASISSGFKSGGYNTSDAQPPFDEEKVVSYEIGAKKTWADGRLTTNAALFYMDYTDLQVQQRYASGTTLISLINNAASSTVKGLEADVTWRASEALTISSSVGLLDATFEDFVTNLPGDTIGTPPTDLSGRLLPNAPEFTGTLSGVYDFLQTPWGGASVRLDYRYQSEVFFDALNAKNLAQEGYGLLNARIALTDADERWEFAIFGENLTDEAYRTSGLDINGFGVVSTFGRSRFVGASLSMQY